MTIGKLGHIKSKYLCVSKDIINSKKEKFMKLEEVFAKYVSNKGLIYRIQNPEPTLTAQQWKRQANNLIQKCTKSSHWYFFREDIKWPKHTWENVHSLITEKMHITATMILTSQQAACCRKQQWQQHNGKTVGVGEEVENLEPSRCARRNVKWSSHCGKYYGGVPKDWKYNHRMTHFWGVTCYPCL